jgi:glycosyltransferase involved in cell wall biosynthesis
MSDASVPEFPKIVILSHHPMSTESAAGLAIRSFFKGWKLDQLVHLFTPTVRWGAPDFDSCNDFRRVSWSGGISQVVESHSSQSQRASIFAPMLKRIASLRSVQKALVPLRETYLTRPYYAKAIQNELAEIAPDVVYVMANSLYLAKAACVACENLDIPMCVHIVDDVDSESANKNGKRTRKGLETEKWFQRLVDYASTHIGISPQMAEEFENRYGHEWTWFTTLTDSYGYDPQPKKSKPGSPIEFVFAGNLSFDRWREVCELGHAIKQLRQHGRPATLTVYGSPTHLKLYGNQLREAEVDVRQWVPVDELGSIFHNADVLVHVESSHDPEMRHAIRLSLSTKISQYMMAGRPILAIGPAELASIKFVKDSNVGMTHDISSGTSLFELIQTLVSQPELLQQLGRNGREKAMKVFEGDAQRERFRQLIRDTIEIHRQNR